MRIYIGELYTTRAPARSRTALTHSPPFSRSLIAPGLARSLASLLACSVASASARSLSLYLSAVLTDFPLPRTSTTTHLPTPYTYPPAHHIAFFSRPPPSPLHHCPPGAPCHPPTPSPPSSLASPFLRTCPPSALFHSYPASFPSLFQPLGSWLDSGWGRLGGGGWGDPI